VAQLTDEGYIDDKIDFDQQSLHYLLRLNDRDQLSASFINNTITLLMPKSMLQELADTDRVGFENTEAGLHLLVEKDFTCLDEVAEDQSDNFPNPLAEKYFEEEG